MTLEEQVIYGQEAERLLTNSAYLYAITSMKGEALSRLQSVSMVDSWRDERDELIRKLQVVSEFESEIESIIENGKYAKNIIERNKG